MAFPPPRPNPALAAAARTASPANCPACGNLTGGLLFAGTNGEPREAFNTDYNHFQPRIVAAYKLGANTVLRGGYSMYYLPQAFFEAFLFANSQPPPRHTTVDQSKSLASSLTDSKRSPWTPNVPSPRTPGWN